MVVDIKEITLKATADSKFKRPNWSNSYGYFDGTTFKLCYFISKIKHDLPLDTEDILADDWEFITEEIIPLSKKIIIQSGHDNDIILVIDLKSSLIRLKKNLKTYGFEREGLFAHIKTVFGEELF